MSGYGHVGGIAPGQYALTVFGRVLWEGQLSEHVLIWATAFPDRPLPLAAATEPVRANSTREIELLGGELAMRIYPGLETGRIELETHLPRSGT